MDATTIPKYLFAYFVLLILLSRKTETKNTKEDLDLLLLDMYPIWKANGLPPKGSDLRLTSRADIDAVKFHFYSDPLNPTQYDEIRIHDVNSLERSKQAHGRPIKFLIHGFRNNAESDFPKNTVAALFANMYRGVLFNIIVVDWGALAGSGFTEYGTARGNVLAVGRHVANLIDFLYEQFVIEFLHEVHLIGHSLGAHVAGVAGCRAGGRSGLLGRITGLDPAGPAFDGKYTRHGKLDKGDAHFVDVIHTNAGDFGTTVDGGHVDFYSDGGRLQKHCQEFLAPIANAICSHSHAHEIYKNTINNPWYYAACPCGRLSVCSGGCSVEILVGEHVPITARGYYYFKSS